ncbi:pentatricopeptide repeat-containing protein At5g14080 [Andrographis paniculata]|uniref:pentatricopeptide repeat-containing protein At5g14080 n=1 Tax=Andrographis paniculata TaxID=175694 RepID=UPI0021E83B64|nr:pentatricopeptide repeat-containing protein At5g14080 [Andrographis paniculata]
MRHSAAELAGVIGRALVMAANKMSPVQIWSPSLEQTLHQLGCRDFLTPTLVGRVIDPFLLGNHHLAFGFFNWAAQQPGFSHSSVSYQSVLKSLSMSRQYSSIDKLLKQARVQRIALHPSVHRLIISSLISGRRTHVAFLVFNEIGAAVREIGPEVCNSLLAALSSEGNVTNAYKVFDEMVKRGVPLSTLGFGVFLWRACRKTGLSEIFNFLDEFKKFNSKGFDGSIIALLTVHGLCMDSRAKEAASALEELRKRNCKPDFMAYRIVAEALREIGDVVDVEMVLKKKRKLGVAPRMDDYRELILQFVSERLINEAKELGEVIVLGNFPMDDDVLNVLIGSASASDPLQAVSFLRFMVEKERFPALRTLIKLSENLCKLEKGDELVEVFQLLSTKDYFYNMESYSVMVSFLCKAARIKEGYRVLQEMKKKGLSPDVSIYNSLLDACCREDLIRPAKRLWDEMFASGCCGDLKSYNILIKKFSELGQVEDACRLFDLMFVKGTEPNESTYKILLQSLCEAKDLEMAVRIFDKSVEQDATLGNRLLPGFILCLCKSGFHRRACKLLQSGVAYDQESNLTLLRHLANIGELPMATKHLQWIAEKFPAVVHAIRIELASAWLPSSLKPDPIEMLLVEIVKVEEVRQSMDRRCRNCEKLRVCLFGGLNFELRFE